MLKVNFQLKTKYRAQITMNKQSNWFNWCDLGKEQQSNQGRLFSFFFFAISFGGSRVVVIFIIMSASLWQKLSCNKPRVT